VNLSVAYNTLFIFSATLLVLLIFISLIRAILGPRFTDRLIAINLICTKGIILIAILSCLLGEAAMLDVAIVYAMISFLAVVVLSKCYILPHHTRPVKLEDRREEV